MKRPLILILSLLFLFCQLSCRKADYPKPQVKTPENYRGTESTQNSPALSGKFLGDLFWWDLVQDEVLKDYIRTALTNNYDARTAAEKILEAQARLGLARAQQYPNLSGVANFTAGKASTVGPTPAPPGYPDTAHSFGVALQAIFELDFWGRLRSTSDAARADLLTGIEAQNVVLLSLVSEVASSYFTLRELDWELEISQKTLAARQKSYELVKSRLEGGVSDLMEAEQAKGLYLTAEASITDTQRKISQQENYLCFLLGKNPGDLKRGKELSQQMADLSVPAGLPSSLLKNRPDIRQAESRLLAANARIDAARAAFFPAITLTGSDGSSSKDFSKLFSTGSSTWSFSHQLALPIFNAGQLKSQVQVSESQQRQLVIEYEKTVQNAFREVSDSLIGYNKMRAFRLQQEELTESFSQQSQLSNLRYQGGVTSYLEVLDTERQYFNSELALANARLNELLYLIMLYKALGGGWKPK